MVKEIIQYSHANGFPAPTYSKLFSLLEDQFDIRYIEQLGHNPNYPVTDNWENLVKELVDNLDAESCGPVIGIGHSLGGVLTLFAAVLRPDLFKAVILLDTPIFAFPKAKVIQWLKKIDQIAWVMPGGRRVNKRRAFWASFKEAATYFRSRSCFKNFTEECLLDYIHYGTTFQESGFMLKYNPEIEANIYQTMPHNYHEYHRRLKVPCVALIGEDSDIFHWFDLKCMEKKFNIRCKRVKGGHLFPFEHPLDTANMIKETVKEIVQVTG